MDFELIFLGPTHINVSGKKMVANVYRNNYWKI